MSDEIPVGVAKNGRGLQIYFPVEFTLDSACPLRAGDEYVARIEDGEVVIRRQASPTNPETSKILINE